MTEPSRNLVVLFCDDDDGWGTRLITFGPSDGTPGPGETEQLPEPASEGRSVCP